MKLKSILTTSIGTFLLSTFSVSSCLAARIYNLSDKPITVVDFTDTETDSVIEMRINRRVIIAPNDRSPSLSWGNTRKFRVYEYLPPVDVLRWRGGGELVPNAFADDSGDADLSRKLVGGNYMVIMPLTEDESNEVNLPSGRRSMPRHYRYKFVVCTDSERPINWSDRLMTGKQVDNICKMDLPYTTP